jgi:hypothetical protein
MASRRIEFFDGFTSETVPNTALATSAINATNLAQYANDAAYIAVQAAADGAIYYNTTSNRVRQYINGAWQDDNATITEAVNITDTTTSTTKDTGALIVEGGVGIEENLNVGGDTILTGNLTVNGTTTSVNTTNLEIQDKNILVNESGSDASSEGAGLTVERVGTDGSIIYEDAATTKFKLGALGSEIEVADISSTQTFTNKTLTSPSIVTPTRSDIKQDTDANLVTYASSASNGQLCFATDTKKSYAVVDSALLELGEGVVTVTTKGDLSSYSTIPARLAVGANNKVLTADSTETTGLKWDTSIDDKIDMNAMKNIDLTRAAPSAVAWTFIASAGTGSFQAVGPNSTTANMASSDMGKTWTAPAASLNLSHSDFIFSTVASLYLVLSSGTTSGIATSIGASFTTRTTSNKTWTAICEGSSLIVAVNNDGSGGDGAMYSTNGTTWTDSTACQDEAWADVASDGSIFVAVGGTGKVSTSTDGDTWTARTAAHTGTLWTSVVWDSKNSQFLAHGHIATTGEYFMTSTDGITWVDGAGPDIPITRILHTGTIYVANYTGGAYNYIFTSSDGVYWEQGLNSRQGTWKGMVHYKGRIWFVSDDATGDRICQTMTGRVVA